VGPRLTLVTNCTDPWRATDKSCLAPVHRVHDGPGVETVQEGARGQGLVVLHRAYIGHTLMENGNGLVVNAQASTDP